jgi:selenocysteine lyase/cysteine desulfurase
MNVQKIKEREQEMMNIIWEKFDSMENVKVFAKDSRDRLPIFSFIILDCHYNLGVKLLNDKFGIQVRGGCSCAGTYGHYLFEISSEKSHELTSQINIGDLSGKPGWIRISFHPTMTNDEVVKCMDAIHQVSLNHKEWSKEYKYHTRTNEFEKIGLQDSEAKMLVDSWFEQLVN